MYLRVAWLHASYRPLVRLIVSLGLTLSRRLTGAGWGGCAVALVSESQVESFMKLLEEGYYSKRVWVLASVGVCGWRWKSVLSSLHAAVCLVVAWDSRWAVRDCLVVPVCREVAGLEIGVLLARVTQAHGDMATILFASKPAGGAAVYRPL